MELNLRMDDDRQKKPPLKESAPLEAMTDNLTKYVLMMNIFDRSRNGIRHLKSVDILERD